jgi:hypothetical protein
MADWWDAFTTRMGDALVGPQQPWGTLVPGMQAPDRQQAIGQTLLSLGAALGQGARERKPVIESLGTGFQNAQQQGIQRTNQQLQGMLVGSKLQEAQRANQTRAALMKNPPAGMTPEMIAFLPAEAIGKLWIENLRADKMAGAYDGAGGGSAPPTGAPAAGGAPSPGGQPTAGDRPPGYSYNIGNLVASGTPWSGQGQPWKAPNGLTFTTFNDPVSGVTAAYKNIQYHVGKGATDFYRLGNAVLGQPYDSNPDKTLNKYGDNAKVWAENVAKMAGLDPKAPIPVNDPQKMALVMRAINRMEHGRETVPPDAYLAGVTGRTIQNQTAGTTQPNPGPQAPGGGPSPVQPVQATQPPGAPPQAPGTPQQGQDDPGLRLLEQSRAAAIRQAKISGKYDQVYQLDAAIAKRRAELTDQQRSGVELTDVWDPQTQTVRRVPRAQGGGTLSPETERIRREQEAARVSAANKPVGPDGTVNEPYVGAQGRIEAQRGTEAARINRESELLKEWNKVGTDRVKDSLGQATEATKFIPTVHAGRALLDKGIISGTGADFRKAFGNALATVGLYNGEDLANTRGYEVAMGTAVLSLVKQLGSGSGITDADRDFARDLVAGKVTLDEKSLRRMLDVTESASRRAIQRHIDLVKPLMGREGLDPATRSFLSVDMPPEYQKAAPSAPAGGQPASGATGATPPQPDYIWDPQQRKLVPRK